MATLRARLRCPTLLLVVCVDTAAAAWASRPIELGNPGSRLIPLVLGPDLVPVVTDTDEARRAPELTVLSVLSVLSALAHGADPGRLGMLNALLAALSSVEKDHRFLYLRLVWGWRCQRRRRSTWEDS